VIIMRKKLVALLVAGLFAATAGTASAEDNAVAWTDSGPVRGSVSEGYRTFQAIPYAAPPVAELRWRSPQPPRRWSQPRDATKPSGACAQTNGGGSYATNEDCLYLNVTTPARRGERKPVMVWLHGGGNSYLSADGFDAHRLAVGADVVVVTTNFRLGVFGFLGHPGLPDSGAYGLEDQQAALRWVRRNAASFGGDPSNVTLFGESGGSWDVCAQLTSPGSAGLFQRAIMQSGGCSMSWPANGVVYGKPAAAQFVSRSQAEADGVALATAHGCADAECLRRLPAAELLTVDNGPAPTVYGNRVLPLRPNQALAEGKFHHVPVISGNTRDEGRLTAAFSATPSTEDEYRATLDEAFGDRAPLVAQEYPVTDSAGVAWGAVLTDHVWVCPQLGDDRNIARRTPVYAYSFADRNAPTGFFPFPPGIPGGAFHSSELAYLFDVAAFPVTFTPEQRKLADQLIGYWGRFAATGNPNGPGLPAWSKFHIHNGQFLTPGDVQTVNLHQQHNCGFWS
jgi:para-nitrobenzyl esterase